MTNVISFCMPYVEIYLNWGRFCEFWCMNQLHMHKVLALKNFTLWRWNELNMVVYYCLVADIRNFVWIRLILTFKIFEYTFQLQLILPYEILIKMFTIYARKVLLCNGFFYYNIIRSWLRESIRSETSGGRRGQLYYTLELHLHTFNLVFVAAVVNLAFEINDRMPVELVFFTSHLKFTDAWWSKRIYKTSTCNLRLTLFNEVFSGGCEWIPYLNR